MKKVEIKQHVEFDLPGGITIFLKSIWFAKFASRRLGIKIDEIIHDESALIEQFFIMWGQKKGSGFNHLIWERQADE